LDAQSTLLLVSRTQVELKAAEASRQPSAPDTQNTLLRFWNAAPPRYNVSNGRWGASSGKFGRITARFATDALLRGRGRFNASPFAQAAMPSPCLRLGNGFAVIADRLELKLTVALPQSCNLGAAGQGST
jgi:hypothetical protein